jgi:hypothetical protein
MLLIMNTRTCRFLPAGSESAVLEAGVFSVEIELWHACGRICGAECIRWQHDISDNTRCSQHKYFSFSYILAFRFIL